jgi:hypothetical protein
VREVEGGDVVVGLFREPRHVRVSFGDLSPGPSPARGGGSGREYVLLANRDPRRAARLRVTLRPEIESIAEMSRKSGAPGRPQLPEDADSAFGSVFAVRLAAGDGRLFELRERRREEWPTPGRGSGISVGGVRVGW